MTISAEGRILRLAFRGREYGPPPGLVHVLKRAKGGDEQAPGGYDPQQAEAKQNHMGWQIAPQPRAMFRRHRAASCSRKRRMLKIIAGIMTAMRTIAIAAARPVFKLVYISIY